MNIRYFKNVQHFFCNGFINKLLTKNIYELQNIIKYNDIMMLNENIQIYKYLQKFSYNRFQFFY